MDREARTQHCRRTIRDDEPAQLAKASSTASMRSSMTYRVQGIPASYSCKSTKKLLDSVLGLDGKESCVQIHSLATSPYDLRENVATVTFNGSVPALTGERVGWKFPF